MKKKINFDIAARLDGKVVVNRGASFDVPRNFQSVCWILIALVYYLRAFLRYVAVKCRFNQNPRIGHLVITVACGNITKTVLDIRGIVSGKAEEINDLLKENELFAKLLNLILNYQLPQCDSK